MAENATAAPDGPVASAVMDVGRLRVGGVESHTTTVAETLMVVSSVSTVPLLALMPVARYTTEPDSVEPAAPATNVTRLLAGPAVVPDDDPSKVGGTVKGFDEPVGCGTRIAALRPDPVALTTDIVTEVLFLKPLLPFVRTMPTSTSLVTVVLAHTLPMVSAARTAGPPRRRRPTAPSAQASDPPCAPAAPWPPWQAPESPTIREEEPSAFDRSGR